MEFSEPTPHDPLINGDSIPHDGTVIPKGRMVGSMFTITIRSLPGVTNPDKALRSALKLPSLYSLIDVQRSPNLRSITTLLVANNEKDELYHAAQDDTHCRCFASSPT